ncbi:MAG: type II secretion system protein GspM, partial [Desulfonatronovibrio sp.]
MISMNMRKKVSTLISWQSRSVHDQKRIALLLIFLTVLLPLSVWIWINSAIQQNLAEKDQIISRYEKAAPLAELIKDAKPDKNNLQGLSPLAATQQVVRDMGIEAKMTSIRPARALQGLNGVQIHIQDLDLPQLLHFFTNLKTQAGIQLISGNLNKRADNPARMDL